MPLVKEGLERVTTYPGDEDVKIGLFKNNVTPDIDTVFGDLTEADFSGYARKSVNKGEGMASDGMQQAVYESAIFTHSGGATDNDVYGWFLIDDGGTSPVLHYAERFDSAPITVDTLDQVVAVDLTAKYGND